MSVQLDDARRLLRDPTHSTEPQAANTTQRRPILSARTGSFRIGQSRPDSRSPLASGVPMCRSIRVLYNFEPPTTRDEIRAAAGQFVRKVSGLPRPSAADTVAFERAIVEIAASTEKLLAALSARTAVRTREHEREKARARWTSRSERISAR